MNAVLYIVGALTTVAGIALFANAPFVTQEMAGLIIVLIGAVLISAAAIIDAILQRPNSWADKQSSK